MANLRVNKITGTEVFETTGSVQFDGNGDFLSLADSADFDSGSGDFTIEGWIYLIGNGESFIFGQSDSGGANATCTAAVLVDSTNILIGRFFSGSTAYEATHSILQKNVWNHFALVRNGSSGFIYLNGVAGTPVSLGSIALNNSSNQMSIGRLGEYNARYFNGHISNFRVVKGTAIYTKNFTPPTRELTVIPNTVLLCCQSTTRANEEKTGKTITVNGNAVANELTPGLLTDRIKSGGTSAIAGSVEFDGTVDHLLTLNSSSDFSMGSGSYTIEFFMNTASVSENSSLVNLIENNGQNFGINIFTTGTTINVDNGLLPQTGPSGGPLSANTWHHIAVVSNGTKTNLYLNGIEVGSYVGVTGSTYSPLFVKIGLVGFGVSSVPNFKGFISNLRITKGTALYTSNFIPPTRELKKLPGTVLLCCQDPNSATQEATGKTIGADGNPTARNFAPSVGFDETVTFDGVTKINTPNYFYLPTGNTESRDTNPGVRGVFSAGYQAPATPSATNVIDYINIASTGNAQDFGDFLTAKWGVASCSSSTRGLIGGGLYPGVQGVNTIDYITINSTGNAQDFGDLTDSRRGLTSCSSSTRGIFAGGYVTSPTLILYNIIEYVTISSTGNAQDFGDTTFGGGYKSGFSSPTRGVMGGDYLYATPTTHNNVIDYITISSTGNAQDFGDLTQNKSGMGAFSNSIRGLFGGGFSPTNLNTIDYVTIASTGNAQDFGDLIESKLTIAGTSSQIRGIFGGGAPSTNLIQYVSIMSTGNSIDFGDLTVARGYFDACSNGHGGLG